MNPMTNMKNIKKLSEQELKWNIKSSWHDQYRNSAWIFVGGLPYDLTEGDIISIFSQYGEIVNINLIRDKSTGKQKGFGFVCYEDQRSTDLAVDNLNGIKILNRTIRVDHVSDYKVPKDHKNIDSETRKLQNEGCGPEMVTRRAETINLDPPEFTKVVEAPLDGFRLPPRLPIGHIKEEPLDDAEVKVKKEKKHKKEKKSKKKKSKKKHKKQSSSESSSEDSDSNSEDDKKKKRKSNSKRDDEKRCKR